MADPVRLYADNDRRVPKRLADLLKEEHQKAFADLVYAQDWADFTARRAKVLSLGDTIKWCADIEKELTG